MTQLSADVARLRQVLARQNGPTIVVGHSYGGQIMTALGCSVVLSYLIFTQTEWRT
jgi:pimeloyl-ACP methyl ester carboxylesterase